MTVTQFLQAVDAIALMKPAYLKGRSGDDGYCDCIGLVIGALRRCGVPWSGTHGTNWAARNAVTDLRPVTVASVLSLGDLVFRSFHPWDSDWSLPSAYANDPDQLDYYHVGVVTSVSPLVITHMTSPTIRLATSLSRWSHTARLLCLSDHSSKGDDPLMYATVISEDGNPVKLRPTPDTAHPYLEKLPVGTTVSVLSQSPDWTHVMAGTRVGYIMTKFLSFEEKEKTGSEEPSSDPTSDNESETIGYDAHTVDVALFLPRSLAELLRDRLNDILS